MRKQADNPTGCERWTAQNIKWRFREELAERRMFVGQARASRARLDEAKDILLSLFEREDFLALVRAEALDRVPSGLFRPERMDGLGDTPRRIPRRPRRRSTIGISPAAKTLLEGWRIPLRTARALQAMTDDRQVEAANEMVRLGSCSSVVALPLLLETAPSQLRTDTFLSQLLILEWRASATEEEEGERLAGETRRFNLSAGADRLEVVALKRYVGKLFASASVAGCLERHYPQAKARLEACLTSGPGLLAAYPPLSHLGR